MSICVLIALLCTIIWRKVFVDIGDRADDDDEKRWNGSDPYTRLNTMLTAVSCQILTLQQSRLRNTTTTLTQTLPLLILINNLENMCRRKKNPCLNSVCVGRVLANADTWPTANLCNEKGKERERGERTTFLKWSHLKLLYIFNSQLTCCHYIHLLHCNVAIR